MGKIETISVSELSGYIRYLLEQDKALQNVQVQGEISNLTKHGSGHWYFTLKDSDSQISCAFFKGARASIGNYQPENGDQVIVKGNISVYPPRGSYQLIVNGMSPAGEGDLHQQFLRLKNKLLLEGLFDAAHKKKLPIFPQKIGVITSLTGAVIRDICQTLRRRWPAIEVIISPARMQGEGTADSVMDAFDLLVTKVEPEVIIIARGGGSMEDLWGFNDERLARKVYKSQIPVISAIGHETDFTILDFVADQRAATPTAAAEITSPDRNDFLARLIQWEQSINREMVNFTLFRRQHLDDLSRQLQFALQSNLQNHQNALKVLEAQINQLDILKVMSRGFSIVTLNNERISSEQQIQAGDLIQIHFHQGKAKAHITETEK